MFILELAGCGREAHGVQDVGVHGGGEGRLDQVYPVSGCSASGQSVAMLSLFFGLSIATFIFCMARRLTGRVS